MYNIWVIGPFLPISREWQSRPVRVLGSEGLRSSADVVLFWRCSGVQRCSRCSVWKAAKSLVDLSFLFIGSEEVDVRFDLECFVHWVLSPTTSIEC